ncbi:hypothetical protein [Rubrivivax rivuli]|uniref:PEP-CTERM protein-sorting domain-containing protein n=1 Tax=Rubrivivax rivuli TaxID=1862385 RepID=A0A437RL48_9BURK|nr:hypothetical protein [Rubrivivax rivuli]RVU47484.1 hypothetical protein EOE66_07015 [Rubrivivax rivuli]
MNRKLNVMRLAGLLAATLAAGSLQAAPLSLSGSSVSASATLNGSALVLLSADSGFAAGGPAQVGDAGVEFITDDANPSLFADPSLQIDFGTSGLLSFFDNTGLGTPSGNYSFSFVFTGLAGALGGVDLDLSLLTAGSVTATVTAPDTVQFTLSGVNFANPFESFSAQLNAAPQAAVPLPGTLALAGLALALMAAPTRRRKEV